MTVLDVLQDPDIDFKLLATDISSHALTDARQGVYAIDKLTPIPRAFLTRFFQRDDSASESYRVREEVKQHVIFRRLNLAQPPFPMRGPLDIVLCRNVLIYFDLPVRQRLLAAISSLLRPEGWLFLGHTETLTGITSGFRMARPSVFFLPDEAEVPAEAGSVP